MKKSELALFITESVKAIIKEEANYYKFSFKGKSFQVKFDTNVNPTKKGVKIQFIPLIQKGGEKDTQLSQNEQNDFANDLQVLLNQRLSSLGMNVDRDLDVPDEDVIGFLLKLNTLSEFLVDTFKQGSTDI